MSNRKQKTEYLVTAALIAAAYTALTFICNIFSLAYGPLQIRISEVLTILPVFTPAAIPGLCIGCFISNIASFNILDIIFGTAATLAAAVLTYILRNISFKGLPLLAMLPPVIINSVVIGMEINIFYFGTVTSIGKSMWGFLISALQIGISEAVVCYALGIPFYLIVKRTKIFGGINAKR